jgi:Fic family protein
VKELLTLHEIRSVPHMAMTPVWTADPYPHATDAEGPGSFRRHKIAQFPGSMKPPSWSEIDPLIRHRTDDVNALQRSTGEPFPEAPARVHNAFERIHPFLGGSGRTARLLLNLLLGRLGYPATAIYERDREKSLKAMRRADCDDHGPIGELIARSPVKGDDGIRRSNKNWVAQYRGQPLQRPN